MKTDPSTFWAGRWRTIRPWPSLMAYWDPPETWLFDGELRTSTEIAKPWKHDRQKIPAKQSGVSALRLKTVRGRNYLRKSTWRKNQNVLVADRDLS